MFQFIKNLFSSKKYTSHDEAVIISCYYNPQNSEYRRIAFDKFYNSIKHMNYRIIECCIADGKSELAKYNDRNIMITRADELLWHKETLLNILVKELPKKFKYVFWVDADVIFDNKNWFKDGVEALRHYEIIQPFKWCIHLNKDDFKPSFTYKEMQDQEPFNFSSYSQELVEKFRMWRSFASTRCTKRHYSENYNEHGHVGFAWGATRKLLLKCPLYEKALIGGADHIIAHGSANQLLSKCIEKTFTEDIENVRNYMQKLGELTGGRIGYVDGTLFHVWHGDIEKRDYFQRIKDFTPKSIEINERDSNGFYTSKNDATKDYVNNYYAKREVVSENDSFLQSMAIGYVTNSAATGAVLGGNWSGAIIGDAMNNNDVIATENNFEFGGGDGGGGGASGSWETNAFS